MSKSKAEEILGLACKSVPADQIEATISSEESATTRFANSIIHQNLQSEKDSFWARVIKDNRIGAVSADISDEKEIEGLMNTAYDISTHQMRDEEFVSLPSPTPAEKKRITKEIPEITPEERADAVQKIVKVCNKYGLASAGAINTGRNSLGIANSLGVNNFGEESDCTIGVFASSGSSSGYAGVRTDDFHSIDFEALAEIASEKAMLGKNPIEAEVKPYTVLLEEQAVAELLEFLAWIGFGARAFQEGRGFMAGKIGSLITGDNITIFDDVYHPQMSGLDFDFEGMPRKRVSLIENGVAEGVVYDSFYANKENKQSTGHALPYPNESGPFPLNLVMEGGNASKSEMLASISNGILITRFWYTRILDPDQTQVTGMTRDGTFLIKNGEIEHGVKNLRFSINILETFKKVVQISQERTIAGEYFRCLVPSLLIEDFGFTGKTEY